MISAIGEIEDYTFEGTMVALSSVTQWGDSVGGTEQFLRREKVVRPVGDKVEIIEVPIISGNSWRGQLRRAGMKAMLQVLQQQLGRPIILPAPAYFLAFSGGSLTKEAGRGIDMGYERYLRSLLPLLGVFGGAVGRHIIEGKLAIHKIVPVCAEVAHLLPVFLTGDSTADPPIDPHPQLKMSHYDLIQMEPYTRSDPAKQTPLAELFLAPPERQLLEQPKVRMVKNAKGEEEEIAEKPGTAQQMRYGFETIAMGTTFSCGMRLRSVTALEFESFLFALREWSKEPIIGGQSGKGHARVKLDLRWMKADPLLQRVDEPLDVGQPFGALYTEHLRTHGDEILQTLGDLA